jgi:hypothetical protein
VFVLWVFFFVFGCVGSCVICLNLILTRLCFFFFFFFFPVLVLVLVCVSVNLKRLNV